MSVHITEDQIKDFVLGLHQGLDLSAVKQHLAECPECAKLAAREAALEHALWEARQHLAECPGCHQVVAPDRTLHRCGHCGVAFRAGRYLVRDLLARTDHSRLYLAVNEAGQEVALKELVFAQIPDAATLAAFEREARILKQLDHPRIPRFLDAFQEGAGVNLRLYLVQEFVAGQSLLQRLEEHRYTESEALDLARQVLSILAYLQRLSPPVFHRDVKPANLIRRDDGTVVLVDFGAARDLGATHGGTEVGTFGYMPVEQLTGAVDSTTDLYALGATLVHVLTRRAPWEVLNRDPLSQTIKVSSGTRELLERMLAPEPGDRFPDAAAALEAVQGRRSSPPERPRARQHRWDHRALLAGMAVASAAVGWAAMASWNVVPTPRLFESVGWLRVRGEVGSGDFTALDHIFLACAILGGLLFVVRVALQLLGGHGHDGDLDHAELDHGDVDDGDLDHAEVDDGDLDHGAQVHHGDAAEAFLAGDIKLLTLQGIMSFLVMFGLVGLALSRQSEFGAFFSLLGALVAGTAIMWVNAKLIMLAHRLQSSGTVSNTAAIGQEGTTYLTIPAGGVGKIQVSFKNRLREFEAKSHGGEAIKTGERVRVVAVEDGRVMVVERISSTERKGE